MIFTFCEKLEKPDPEIVAKLNSRMWKGLTPRVFPLLVGAPSSCCTGDSNSCPPNLELGAPIRRWYCTWV